MNNKVKVKIKQKIMLLKIEKEGKKIQGKEGIHDKRKKTELARREQVEKINVIFTGIPTYVGDSSFS